MKDYDLDNYTLSLPTSEHRGDPYLGMGASDNDSYFTEGEETFDDGVRSFTEPVEKPKPDVEALLAEIESQVPDEVLELFGQKKSKKKEAA